MVDVIINLDTRQGDDVSMSGRDLDAICDRHRAQIYAEVEALSHKGGFSVGKQYERKRIVKYLDELADWCADNDPKANAVSLLRLAAQSLEDAPHDPKGHQVSYMVFGDK